MWGRGTIFQFLDLFVVLMLGVMTSTNATAQSPIRNRNEFQILKLFCSLREGSFLTQFYFKNQVIGDRLMLTAELANYSISPSGSKKYLSGQIFTNVQYNNTKATGDANHPSDLSGKFFLTRIDANYQGRWAYQYYRTDYDIIRAVFNCSYNDSPATDRGRKP
jgi:hypothetical protein